MPKGLHEMNVDELQQALAQRAFEVALIVRALSLHGIHVDLDLVERTNAAHPEGYTEIIVGKPHVAD